MTVRLPPERRKEIIDLCKVFLQLKRVEIRKKFSQLIGKLVATHQGVEYASLYYKPLEKVKEQELKKHNQNYSSFMTIPKCIYPVIQWWIDNVKWVIKQSLMGNQNSSFSPMLRQKLGARSMKQKI